MWDDVCMRRIRRGIRRMQTERQIGRAYVYVYPGVPVDIMQVRVVGRYYTIHPPTYPCTRLNYQIHPLDSSSPVFLVVVDLGNFFSLLHYGEPPFLPLILVQIFLLDSSKRLEKVYTKNVAARERKSSNVMGILKWSFEMVYVSTYSSKSERF